ncbi:hypothetical protein WICMUC_004093 [Wickerhamomyces mucosus]|uniref:Alpha/beta hydrolase fold-3 domain-containing protein n=1 Tax=Wickerhamomyces mucosus TaxID=1378264 RepID=A0A9P8TBC8_9ASCO|nr:hypothetical protein WICMUC_004093 [Wickerhamomyces mucosus]
MIFKNHFNIPFLDGFAAIKYIVAYRNEFNADKERISICGASAGGYLVLALGYLLRDFNLKVKLVLTNVPPTENYINHETVDTIKMNFLKNLKIHQIIVMQQFKQKNLENIMFKVKFIIQIKSLIIWIKSKDILGELIFYKIYITKF